MTDIIEVLREIQDREYAKAAWYDRMANDATSDPMVQRAFLATGAAIDEIAGIIGDVANDLQVN